MTLRRLFRTPKTLAQKGKPGAIARHVIQRVHPDGTLREFHFTKGWRRYIDSPNKEPTT